MAKDYSQMASQLFEAVGGKNNIASVSHCATRLRFQLKEAGKASADKAKAISGVITVVEKGGQFQVVIGNEVQDAYKEVIKQGGFDENAAQQPSAKGNIINRIIDVISGVFPPVLGVLAGAALVKGLLSILMVFNLITPDMGTYMVLSAVGDAAFYFLPILLGFSAGRKFGGNPYLTALIGAILIHPTITASAGTTITFLKIPMVLMNYSSSVIPILVAAWLCAKLEIGLDAVLPKVIRKFVTPMLVMMIVVPITLWVIGPVTIIGGNFLASGYSWLMSLSPALGGAFVGGIWQVLVIFGMHWGFVPIMLNNVATMGQDSLGVIANISALSQTGAAFGMSLKMKNKEARALTLSNVFTGIFGITEPIVYGITLPRKKPFITGVIGGVIGGATAGALGAMQYSMGAFGLLNLFSSIGPDGFGKAFFGSALGFAVAFTSAAILTYIVYKDDTVKEKTETKQQETAPTITNSTLYAPLEGKVDSLSKSSDAVHAAETLGKGAMVLPEQGMVYAPFDGMVEMFYDSKHALGLLSDDGTELLIHIGIDTVKLEGKYFDAKVAQGDRIVRGQPLLQFDIEKIKQEGYSIESQVVVTNTESYKKVELLATGDVKPGAELLKVTV